ncbi:MAG: hypothetical protein ABI742_06065 [Gemmatimonadota bacterium]
MVTPSIRSSLALLGCIALPRLAAAQAAVDPSVAPRAALMAAAGQRTDATEMLGRYLATAPDDGQAWLELGQFYILDSREWHRRGHSGEPSSSFFLDFAATALDASLRLPTDSAMYLRAMVEMDRAAMQIEEDGWLGVRAGFVMPNGSEPPAYLLEAGRNLINSCPVGGVLVTGTELEAVAAWSAVLGDRSRGDLILLLPTRYEDDSLYRLRMAEALDMRPIVPVGQALTFVASRRPVCLSPTTDSTTAPRLPLIAFRLVRIAGPEAPEVADPLGIIELTAVERSRPILLSREVVDLYTRAARYNPVLCTSLLVPLGARQRNSCGR